MRRGLTLIELLLAIALLAGLAAATVPLTQLAFGGMHQIDQDLLWTRSAEMALNEIDNLMVRRDRRETRNGPVEVNEQSLRIRLTGGAAASVLVREGQLRQGMPGQPERVLIGSVGSASFEIDEQTGVLRVQLASQGGRQAERAWELGS